MPQLRYVIAVFNQDVSIEPTLAQALSDVLGANVTGISTGTTPTKPGGSSTKTVAAYLAAASQDYANAQAALAKGNLGLYQSDVERMNQQLLLAQNALSATSTGSSTSTSTTTTTTTTTTTSPST